MPNQTTSNAQFYFDLSNYERARTLSKEIAEHYGLVTRDSSKDYGYIKVDSDYSESFVDWTPFSDEELLNKKSRENPMYTLWSSMYARCYNRNSIGWFYYGDRGISMDPEWKSNFKSFASDILGSIGRKPERFYSIDRIDNNGNYVLSNVRWAAPLKQARNRQNIKVGELSGLTLAMLYKYYKTTGVGLKEIYNEKLAPDEAHKITKSWGPMYNACRSYCQFV